MVLHFFCVYVSPASCSVFSSLIDKCQIKRSKRIIDVKSSFSWMYNAMWKLWLKVAQLMLKLTVRIAFHAGYRFKQVCTSFAPALHLLAIRLYSHVAYISHNLFSHLTQPSLLRCFKSLQLKKCKINNTFTIFYRWNKVGFLILILNKCSYFV